VQFGVFKTFGVTGSAVEASGRVRRVCAGFAFFPAKSAASVYFVKAFFRYGGYGGAVMSGVSVIGNHCADSSAAAFFRYQHIVHPECAEAGEVRDMPVGPAAYKRRFVKIMGSGNFPGPVTVFFKQGFNVPVYHGNKLVGFDVSQSPFRRSRSGSGVTLYNGFVKGDKKANNAFCVRQNVGGKQMIGRHCLFEPGKIHCFCRGKSDDRLTPHAVKAGGFFVITDTARYPSGYRVIHTRYSIC
jgi:hypothetical protein